MLGTGTCGPCELADPGRKIGLVGSRSISGFMFRAASGQEHIEHISDLLFETSFPETFLEIVRRISVDISDENSCNNIRRIAFVLLLCLHQDHRNQKSIQISAAFSMKKE